MAINKKLNWPAGLFFETSILRQLPPELNTAEFMRLRELCSTLEIPMFIPRLVLDEWTFDHQQRVLGEISRIEESLQNIRNYVTSKPSISWPTKKELILQEVEDYLKKSVTEIGMQIIERPEISLDILLDMSVKKTRPFEERGEKGFRDTVILFTVLSHAKKLPNGNHLLLTADKGYDHEDVYRIVNTHNVKLLIVCSW